MEPPNAPQPDPEPADLTTTDVARLIKKSRNWVILHVREIPHERYGKTYRFRRSDVERYRAQRRHKAEGGK